MCDVIALSQLLKAHLKEEMAKLFCLSLMRNPLEGDVQVHGCVFCFNV